MSRTGYARLSNEFWRNTKIRALKYEHGMAPIGLFATIIAYCSDTMSDGYVSQAAMRYQLDADEADLQALVDMGMLIPEEDGGYTVHDYLVYQNSREHIARKRAAGNNRQRKYRQKAEKATGKQNEEEA